MAAAKPAAAAAPAATLVAAGIALEAAADVTAAVTGAETGAAAATAAATTACLMTPVLVAATTFSAASAMVSALMIGRPESFKICLPSTSLVPFIRTTKGTCKLTALLAATTPLAMVSHFMMPPKMLTKMAFKFGFFNMILKASVTFSVVAPPPTSKKLAGSPP